MHRVALTGWVAWMMLLAASAAAEAPSFLTFESGQVRPLAISPDESLLFAVNTPDNRLEIFDVDVDGALTHLAAVPVGMEPIAVAARANDEVWVVNHLSDSVSIVALGGGAPRVVRTLLLGDEPRDIVFAGPDRDKAFITTAHRGQNSPFPRAEYDVAGAGRADVWVFDANSPGASLGGDPLTVVTLFGDKPRALAVSPDGTTVYAAVFRSGNQTTVINEGLVCDTSQNSLDNDLVEEDCSIQGATMPGGIPLPHTNHEDIVRPETGLILKWNRDGGTSNEWQDELGRNWNNAVKFDLPDEDVFLIDANADPPVETGTPFRGVGTVLFNMAVNPVSGTVYVSNLESQNHVRFEGPGTFASAVKPGGEPASVRGNLAHTRITVLQGSAVHPRHLNGHIPYGAVPVPGWAKDRSLSTPLGMAISGDGQTLYLAAFGSSKIGIFDTGELEAGTFDPNSPDHIEVAGGGPSGLVLRGQRIYVMTRFDNSVRVIDLGTRNQVQSVVLHNPEPPEVLGGRRFLYDARLTGSNGEASCASCHIFGDMDDLAWDLGNPDGDQKDNNNPFNPAVPPQFDPLPRVFHPMKGGMATMSLRGLVNMGPQHWRGDREGDEEFSFNAFNAAFPDLVGRDEGELTTGQMQSFTDFALQLRYPPNPIRNLDNTRRADEQRGFELYTGPLTTAVSNCEGCHTLDPNQGHFGGDGRSTFEGETQHFKIPHLRNLYQKVGMFGVADDGGADPPFTHQGDQVRGFGFLHNGSVDTLFRFTSSSVFTVDAPEQRDLEAFLLAFDSDLAPVVGQQVTLNSDNETVADPRVDLLKQRALTDFRSKILGGEVKECDLVAKLVDGGVSRGYLMDPNGDFEPDDGGPAISDAALRDKALLPGQEVTYTCAPPGSGVRMALDRDEDDLLDGVETDTGSYVSPQDTGTDPALADSDGDGFADGVEVAAGTDPTNRFEFPGSSASAVPTLPGPALGILALGLLATLLIRRVTETRAKSGFTSLS